MRNALHKRNLGKRIDYVKFFKIPCVIQLIFKYIYTVIKNGSMLRYVLSCLTKPISWFPDSREPDVEKWANLCFFAKLLCMKPQRCDLTAKWNREKKRKEKKRKACVKYSVKICQRRIHFKLNSKTTALCSWTRCHISPSVIRSFPPRFPACRCTTYNFIYIVIIGSDLWHTP